MAGGMKKWLSVPNVLVIVDKESGQKDGAA
jgi:hypothetical protein